MKFYMFNGIKRQQPEYCRVGGPPGDSMLSYRMAGGKRVDRRYTDFPEWATVYMDEEFGGHIATDFLSNTDSIIPVSKRMKEVIEAMATNEIEYLQFSLFDLKERLVSDDYFVINIIGSVDCMDLEASKIDWSKSCPGEIVDIDRFVLSADKLKDVPDLFRIKEAPREYVVSERLKAEFEKHEFTNVNLIELDVK